jgi:threonine synthase
VQTIVEPLGILQDGKAAKTPAMVGYQAEGSAPFKQGAMVDNPETIATAIRIGHPQSWDFFHHRVNINHCIFTLCNRSIRVF